MAPTQDPDALMYSLTISPPDGSPWSLPIPGSEVEGRSAVYRHFKYVDTPLLKTLDPRVLTGHDILEVTAQKVPNSKCLGHRPWDPVTKTYGNYQWITYGEVAVRRRNFGVGLVELHKQIGITGTQYGVGLWCQNRPEWQLTGMCLYPNKIVYTHRFRFGLYVSIPFHRLHLRYTWT